MLSQVGWVKVILTVRKVAGSYQSCAQTLPEKVLIATSAIGASAAHSLLENVRVEFSDELGVVFARIETSGKLRFDIGALVAPWRGLYSS